MWLVGNLLLVFWKCCMALLKSKELAGVLTLMIRMIVRRWSDDSRLRMAVVILAMLEKPLSQGTLVRGWIIRASATWCSKQIQKFSTVHCIPCENCMSFILGLHRLPRAVKARAYIYS